MEMQRRHLERAVLLSLLLANVCRTGGGPLSIIHKSPAMKAVMKV